MSHRIAIDARKVRDFGIGTYIRNLVRELGEIDQENHYLLITCGDGRDAWKRLPDNFEIVPGGPPVYSLRELVALSWRLLRLKVDLYHSTHYVLPLWVPCKAVVTIHDIIHLLYPEYLPNRLAFFYAERMIRHSLHRGDRILTVSHNTKNDLRDYFGLHARNIEVIYNGIESTFHQQLDVAERDRWLTQLELEPGYVLFVGNPKPHKNLDNVLKAYALAVERGNIQEKLVIVGDRSGLEHKINQRASQLGIEQRVVLPGHVAQEALPAIYQGASLFLYPTLYEGFGLPVIEAMASGVPVITSNSSSLKEIAAGYATLVNPLDIDAIAAAIERTLSDATHRKSLASAGKRRSQDFSWQRTARQTLDIYRLVLEEPGTSAHTSAQKRSRTGA